MEQILEQIAQCLENGAIECGGEFEIRPGGLLYRRVACESCVVTTDVFALSTTCEAVLLQPRQLKSCALFEGYFL